VNSVAYNILLLLNTRIKSFSYQINKNKKTRICRRR